jgi:hypothetical protein
MSSQFGEDAIVERLFARIGTTNKFAVEFGARDGVGNSNTHALRVHHGWTCVLLDCCSKAAIVSQIFLTAENLQQTFLVHRVPKTFDLLSIDVDGNDFHLWKALTAFTPRVVVIEYNSRFGPDESRVMPYNPAHRWDKTDYYGASAAALVKLGREKGYTLVDYTPKVNLFFVKDDANLPPKAPYGYPPAPHPRWEVY